MPRALIVKLGAIGDVVMALPAARKLHVQGYEVDWVCGKTVLPLLELFAWVHPVVVDERTVLRGGHVARTGAMLGLWRRLRGRRYDLVATLYYDRRYRLLTLPVRGRRRVSLLLKGRERRLLPGRHHTDEYARIVLGLKDELRPEPMAPVRVPRERLPESAVAAAVGRRVVLAPGGAKNLLADDALRRWPVENYVKLARMLRERGVEVVLVGAWEDEWVVEHFAMQEVVNCVGTLSLPQLLALLDEEAGSTVLVTHDTGPLHLGGMTRAGLVGVFGPTDPRGRLPQRAGTVALWGGEGFACRPCYDGQRYADCPANDCMRQVGVEMVFDEVMGMFEGRGKGVTAGPRVVTPDSTVRGEGLVVIKGGKS